METIDRLAAGIDQARPLIAATPVSSYGQPTPCTDWTVRELINHMLGALTMFRDVAVDGEADPALFGRDLIGSDASASFGLVAEQVLAGWRAPGRIDGMAKLPFGEFPATFALQFPALDMVVHGWDLAQSTGQKPTWNEALVAENAAFAESTLGDQATREGFYAAAVSAADGAPEIDRLVAFLGRRPS